MRNILLQTTIPHVYDLDLPDIARRLAGRQSRKMLGFLREAIAEIIDWPEAAYSVTTRNLHIIRGRRNQHGMFVADNLGYDALVITPIIIFLWGDIFNVELLPALRNLIS